jgi:ribosomal-protein-alanine N-acetyltransferase
MTEGAPRGRVPVSRVRSAAVRAAHPEEREALADLQQLCIGDDDGLSAVSWRRALAMGRVGTTRVWCVGEPRSPLAAIVVRWRPNGDEARVLALLVHPDHQRQGLGTRLMRHAVAHLAGLCRIMTFEVRVDNAVAQAFYRRLGFRPTDHLPNFYGDGSDALRWQAKCVEIGRKRLTSRPNP